MGEVAVTKGPHSAIRSERASHSLAHVREGSEPCSLAGVQAELRLQCMGLLSCVLGCPGKLSRRLALPRAGW